MSKLKAYNGTSWETVNGQIVGDTLPIGAIVEYDGQTIPAGWEEVSGTNKIKKVSQSAGLLANVSNTSSNSTADSYSCNYVNAIQNLLQTNKTSMPSGQATNCLMIDDFTTTHLCLYYNPINAPESNKMIMWKAFLTDNNSSDAYWTYIVLAITLDDHKLWLNAYHKINSDWTGWNQI